MAIRFLHQNTEKRRDLILHGPITSTLLLLSMPTLMMGLVQSMMPFIDGLFINRIIGSVAASAVNYSGPIYNMFVAAAQGLSVAGMAVIGQMNGLGNIKEGRRISVQVFAFASILGILTAPLLFLTAIPIAHYVNHDISAAVFTYLALSALVIPFSFLESTYNAIKNASGKPEATFIRMVIMLVLKIIFNTLFIFFFHWGIVGAVMASLASNVLITFWMYYELFIKRSEDRLILTGFKLDFNVLKTLIHIGIPSMLTSLILNLGFFLINNEVQKYGYIVLNAQGIASTITGVAFNLPSAFGSAVTTMVSMNVGAGQGEKAKSSLVVGTIMSVIVAVILIAIIVPLSPYMTQWFTNEQEVLDIANRSLRIYTYSVVGFGIAMVEQGAFIGLGRTKVPLVTGILRIWALRYVFILLTEHALSFYAVFWGNLFSNYAAAAITTVLILKVKWVSFIPNKEMVKKENLAV